MRHFILALCLFATSAFAEDIGNNSVCFVPGPEDCAMVAVGEIAKAQRTISVQAYQLTEPHITQALIDAKERGVSVRLIVDKTAPKERNGETITLANAGIPTWVDYKPRIAHNKVIVIDAGLPDAEVLQGSFNWTTNAALHNSENLLVMRDAALASAYETNFENRLELSADLNSYEQSRSH